MRVNFGVETGRVGVKEEVVESFVSERLGVRGLRGLLYAARKLYSGDFILCAKANTYNQQIHRQIKKISLSTKK